MIELVTRLVECATGRGQSELFGETRGEASVARARQVAMYLSHIGLSLSLARVGEMFSREKSTVGHAVHQIEDLRDDPVFDHWMTELEEALRLLVTMSDKSGLVLSGVWKETAPTASGVAQSLTHLSSERAPASV
ncbi:MAG: chromosomal replication initiator DnaA [Ponticaulis sp.]|nr:chromosomal replication initiator DnaA [Ponticaulis sp.]